MIKLTLKSWRINANFTRFEVGLLLGKSEKTIYNWENGIQIPNDSNLEKLAKIYHAKIENIFLGDKSALSDYYNCFRIGYIKEDKV